MGAQRGLEVHVLDHQADEGKADLVRQLGGTYHTDGIAIIDRLRPDVLMECTGAPALIVELLGRTAPAGIVCLVGVTAPGHEFKLDIGCFNRTLVLDNDTVFGAVNANRLHYELAADTLKRPTAPGWTDSSRAGLRWTRGPMRCERRPDDIKVIIDFT